MKKILFILCSIAALTGCKGNTSALLPNVSGKAGEIVVVMEKSDWEGALGGEVRDLLASDCPYLIQQEPLYSLATVTPSGFGDMFRIHRNILIFNIGSQIDSCGIIYKHDAWARPQCVIQINGNTAEDASAVLAQKSANILNSFEQAERDRVIRNSLRYEEGEITRQIMEVFGGAPHIPIGYRLRKITSDFAWIADDKQTIQGIFIYRYPVDSDEPFLQEQIIGHRNAALKANVPGMFDNTWMTTGTYFTPMLQYVRYKNRQFAELRGYWEVVNDFMGGPFVSHSFYSEDGKDIIVAEAWVYAPKYDKRQYLRQTESILYSWEWAKKENEN